MRFNGAIGATHAVAGTAIVRYTYRDGERRIVNREPFATLRAGPERQRVVSSFVCFAVASRCGLLLHAGGQSFCPVVNIALPLVF